ncbi:PREDICTED: uncharacterized protein LOC105505856 [Colobus angolensis palliatus]|uniref:uncharacterized protein LOC105505856 n=1 Tax=Colobus angolensis palliatus TaxID=336983 RepID=UPI0005F3B550|nr:PREDICTED: uncharacterized protein LOC105505856 [Colobus angolensis palliatus]
MRGLGAGFPAQGARLRSRGPRCHRRGLGSVHHAPLCSRGLGGDGGLRKVAFMRHRSTPPAGRADLDGAFLLGTWRGAPRARGGASASPPFGPRRHGAPGGRMTAGPGQAWETPRLRPAGTASCFTLDVGKTSEPRLCRL